MLVDVNSIEGLNQKVGEYGNKVEDATDIKQDICEQVNEIAQHIQSVQEDLEEPKQNEENKTDHKTHVKEPEQN